MESYFGYDYTYRSDTDDEKKYQTEKNRRFKRYTQERKDRHVFKLWKKVHSLGFVCAIMIS